jgi:hypothetical protein
MGTGVGAGSHPDSESMDIFVRGERGGHRTCRATSSCKARRSRTMDPTLKKPGKVWHDRC